jgi:hypothetical protein
MKLQLQLQEVVDEFPLGQVHGEKWCRGLKNVYRNVTYKNIKLVARVASMFKHYSLGSSGNLELFYHQTDVTSGVSLRYCCLVLWHNFRCNQWH